MKPAFQVHQHPPLRVTIAIFFMFMVLAQPALHASEADIIVPEAFSSPQPMHLTEKSDRQAQAMARFLESIFQEETNGPDKALDIKRQVLTLDPAFVPLAIDVAHQYLRKGETAEAISVLKDAVKASPKVPAPNLALAAIYLRQLDKPALAETHALQALAIAPDDFSPYESLWEIYRLTSQPQKIENLFQKALKRGNADAEFWVDLADLRIRDSTRKNASPNSEEIEVLLDNAAVRAGDNAQMLARIADYFISCERFERASPIYERALALKPSLTDVRKKLSECFVQSGRTTEAIKLLEEIVRMNPLDIQAYDQLARLHLDAKDLPHALANLRQSLLLAPREPRRYDDIICLSLSINDTKGALDTAIEAEKQFPFAVEFTLYRAIALSKESQHEEAMKAFEKTFMEAGTRRPELLNGEFYFNYGLAAEQAGRVVKAAELFRKSIELDPQNSARAYNCLGYMWADRNENLDEAEELIHRALELEPDNGAYLDSLGWVYFRKNKYTEAIAELLRAAELLKEPDAVVYEHIGDTYEKLGKIAEAVLYWQKALPLDPESHSLTAKLDAHSARVAQQPKSVIPQTQGH